MVRFTSMDGPRIIEAGHEAILKECNGHYVCPKDADGKRLGHMVGYAGRYPVDPNNPTSRMLQYVGDEYWNFAKAEPHAVVRRVWGQQLAEKVQHLGVTVVVAAPMGGILLASSVADALECRVIFAEKQIIALATPTQREVSQLVLSRHDLEVGDMALVMEDVCNNFSTTQALLELIEVNRANPVGIGCALNRSSYFTYTKGRYELGISSLVHKVIPEYKQNDPFVVEDVAANNVVWKPKIDWDKLAADQQAYAAV